MRELFAALKEAMASGLSAHQREVLLAVALNDVPIDVLGPPDWVEAAGRSTRPRMTHATSLGQRS